MNIAARLIKNHGLKCRDLDCPPAPGILASYLVIQADAVVASFYKTGSVPFVGTRRKLGFPGSPAPPNLVFQRGSALRAVNLGLCRFILFVEEIPFIHSYALFTA